MAKKRKTIGSVIKGKDGKADYIKIGNEDVVLKAGSYVNLESKKQRLESLDKAVADGKMKPETAEKVKAAVEKTPDFVRFSLSITVDE